MFDKKEFKILLLKKAKSIEELAEFLGISKSTLYRKINGKSDFYRYEIQECCKFFGEEKLDRIFFAEKVT